MNAKENREAIFALHKKGKSVPFIIKTLNMPRSTVYKAVKRFNELGTSKDRPRSGRPVTASTPENVEKIRNRIRRNPDRSMRKMAKSIRINEKSVRIIVKKRLKLLSYKQGNGHFISEEMKINRLKKCRKLLRWGNFWSVLFTDEKIFTVERTRNCQNDRQILRNRKGRCKIFRSIGISNKFREKSSSASPFPTINNGVGRNHGNWKDAFGFRRTRG